MLWSIDRCQNRVSADQYHLTVSRAQVSTHRGRVFFEVIRWQVATFQMIAGSSSIFLKCIWNKSCSWAALLKFWFQTDLGNENSTGFYILLTFPTTVTRWSRSTSNFCALIGQNLTGEIMRKIYAASWNLFTLTAEADRVLFQLVIFLTVFFSTGCTKWNTAAIKNLLFFMASLFIGFLIERCVACQSPKSDFGWHRSRFSPCLMRKKVQKSQAILALLDSFQKLHLEW